MGTPKVDVDDACEMTPAGHHSPGLESIAGEIECLLGDMRRRVGLKRGAAPPRAPRSAGDVDGRRARRYARTYTIDPLKSKRAQNWDGAICGALMYTAVVPPAEVAFAPADEKPLAMPALFAINQAARLRRNQVRRLPRRAPAQVNLVFFFDMILQFFVAYQEVDSRGNVKWVDSHSRVIRHYLTGWFPLDAFTVYARAPASRVAPACQFSAHSMPASPNGPCSPPLMPTTTALR